MKMNELSFNPSRKKIWPSIRLMVCIGMLALFSNCFTSGNAPASNYINKNKIRKKLGPATGESLAFRMFGIPILDRASYREALSQALANKPNSILTDVKWDEFYFDAYIFSFNHLRVSGMAMEVDASISEYNRKTYKSKVNESGFTVEGGIGNSYGGIGGSIDYSFYNIDNSHLSAGLGIGNFFNTIGYTAHFRYGLGENHRWLTGFEYGVVAVNILSLEQVLGPSVLTGYQFFAGNGFTMILQLGISIISKGDNAIEPAFNFAAGYHL